jgi:hypothetical protein
MTARAGHGDYLLFIDRLQYTTRFTLRSSFEVVLIHDSIILITVRIQYDKIIIEHTFSIF